MNRYLFPAVPALFSGLLVLSLCGCTHYGDNEKKGHFFEARGMRMYYEEYGSGEPLLLIHGNGGSIRTFSGLIPFYKLKYRVIVADSRAQGKSVDDRDSLSFEMMADDYAALLDNLHVDSANVIGWSDGGIVALVMAMRHPEKTRKIVASGPNLWPDSSAIRGDEWLSEVRDYNEQKDKPHTTEKEKRAWKLLLLDLFQPNIAADSLRNIKCPVLIVGGDHDLITTPHLTLISEHIPQSNLWILSHSGHGTFFEHKYKFLYNTHKFLTSEFRKDRVF